MPTSIPLPQLHIGKRKTRSQVFEILTIDGRWIDKELPVDFGASDDDVSGMAVLIDEDNQYQAEDQNFHQIISEKSCIPICMRKTSKYLDNKNDEKDLAKTEGDIFEMMFEKKKADLFSKMKDSEKWDKMLWAISIVCGTFAIIAAMAYFT